MIEKISRMGSGKLFFIFLGMYSNFYDSNNLTVGDISLTIRLTCYCIYHLWLYTILIKIHSKLLKFDKFQQFQPLLQYKIGLVITIVSMLLMSLNSQENAFNNQIYNSLNIQIKYTEPIEYALIYLGGLLLLISIVAKSLVMLEKRKEVQIVEYYKTVLMLLFPFIGVWFIQSRLEKIIEK